MGRHQIPRHTKRRLVAAGTAAVVMIGTAVGIGIFGSAQADDLPDAAVPEECLPEVVDPPVDETAPDEETQPPEEETQPPEEESEPPESETEPPEPEEARPPSSDVQPPGEETEPPESEVQPPETEEARYLGLARHPGHDSQQPESDGEEGTDAAPADDPGAPVESGPEPVDQPSAPPEDAIMDEFEAPECDEETAEIGPFADDFVKIWRVRPNNADRNDLGGRGGGRNASTGTFVSSCGVNEEGHRNPDNFVATPGVPNSAQHTHDYVGNLSADAFSTDESLQAADTTCEAGDKSSYYWPVLRVRDADGGGVPDEENPHNVGEILTATAVTLEFRGNARSQVVAMPEFLRLVTGDAKASTNGGANANAKWTCTGFENRITTKYPLCPRGSDVTRILDFPSCWDGVNTDSENHRTHVLFPDGDGACAEETQAIPQLRMTLTYDVPRRSVFAVDAFPEELHNPLTDHGDFANVMPEELMNQAVDCINSGRNC